MWNIPIKLLALCLLVCNLSLQAIEANNPIPHVLVSVAPHKFFVEKIADGTVTIGLMVPAGASAHTYEPTPRQIVSSSRADIWFCSGEGFEARAVKALKSYRTDLAIVDLRTGVDMIKSDPHTGCACCHANGQDLHIWLSCRQVKVQASTIAAALSQRYPENAQRYQAALAAFHKELDALDSQINETLRPVANKAVLVSHPAYAYFCRDYQLGQMSIEFEGKDPTPQQLNNILIKARAAKIDKVFVQPQYSSKGAKLIAKEIGASVVMLDPYSEDFIKSMQEIARQFAAP